MLAAIIFTANHYVLDAVIGGAIVLAALGAVRLAEGVRLPRYDRVFHFAD
jgi:hypothetical protein